MLGACIYKYRWHDARLCRFISVDPLRREYGWLSPYAFSENRVIDGVEWEGLELFLIHGSTQYESGPEFSEDVIEELMDKSGNKVYDSGFRWEEGDSRFNDKEDRGEAAKRLAEYVLERRSSYIEEGLIGEDEPATLVGYSHGGNVGIQALDMVKESLGQKVNLITISTPAYNDRGSEDPITHFRSIGVHWHFVHEEDWVAEGVGDLSYSYPGVRNFVIREEEVKGGARIFLEPHRVLQSSGEFVRYLQGLRDKMYIEVVSPKD